MEDKKSIDRFFQENFKDFEVTPGSHVWSSIENKMGRPQRKRRIYPFILRYGSIAAGMALLITLGYNLNTSNDTIPENITTIDPGERIINNAEDTPNIKENIPRDENAVVDATSTGSDNTTQYIPVKNTLASNDNIASAHQNTILNEVEDHPEIATDYPETSEGIAQNSPVRQNNTITEDVSVAENSNGAVEDKKSILDIAKEKSNVEDEAIVQNTSDRWSVSPNAAPVYFNSIDGGSPIDNQFRDNSKSGNVTMSYGVNVAYQVNNRLSVRSGLNRVNYGYNTNNIEFSANLKAARIPTISYDNNAENVTVADINTSQLSSPESMVSANKASAYEGKMVQELGYLEVPLEVKYRLLNKKLGVNLIGGVSSLFLTDNAITLQTDALTTQIGTANNINEVNFSTNIGVGVDYKFSDKVLFNVEPMFKYQLNTFSNDNGGFKPYSLGVYTGLSFRF